MLNYFDTFIHNATLHLFDLLWITVIEIAVKQFKGIHDKWYKCFPKYCKGISCWSTDRLPLVLHLQKGPFELSIQIELYLMKHQQMLLAKNNQLIIVKLIISQSLEEELMEKT